MATLTARPTRVIVDRATSTRGSSEVTYEKASYEEFWFRKVGGNWLQPNLFEMIGTSDADERGVFQQTIEPSQSYEFGIYQENWGPESSEPQPLAYKRIVALWKQPGPQPLIEDDSGEHGGTFEEHWVKTSTTTFLALAAVSQTEPVLDVNAMLLVRNAEGTLTNFSTDWTNLHQFRTVGLLPGRHYYLGIIVMDENGNWDQRVAEFDCARRKLTVQFPTLHIYNDSDPSSYGEAQFWFRVQYPDVESQPRILGEYYRPTSDIDNWSETDRPYPLGFAYIGDPQVAEAGEDGFILSSWAAEDDGWEGDETAQTFDPVFVGFPVGNEEVVKDESLTIDCQPSNQGSDFHYGVDVIWSVEYQP